LSVYTVEEDIIADPVGHVVEDVDLRPLACWDCGFDPPRAWM
jgi:hypothetical protein